MTRRTPAYYRFSVRSDNAGHSEGDFGSYARAEAHAIWWAEHPRYTGTLALNIRVERVGYDAKGTPVDSTVMWADSDE